MADGHVETREWHGWQRYSKVAASGGTATFEIVSDPHERDAKWMAERTASKE
jgi:hypothetical protein